jgi:hypothetical protein
MINKYLESYINQRDALQKDIDNVKAPKNGMFNETTFL